MDEKKKIIAMVLLFIVVIGVGAFQFSSIKGPSESSAVKQKVEQEKKLEVEKKKLDEENGNKEIINPMFAQNLPARDPFCPGTLPEEPTGSNNTNQLNPQPLRPANMGPGFKPFDPGATIPMLPGTGNQKGTIGIQQTAPIQPADQLAYSLKGILLGEKPAAVFQDDSGNQRLVALGGSIDGDSRVTNISQGTVTVRHKGKTVTLTVGANANEK